MNMDINVFLHLVRDPCFVHVNMCYAKTIASANLLVSAKASGSSFLEENTFCVDVLRNV